MPEVILTFKPFKLVEGSSGGLVEAACHGPGLLRLGDQHRVTSKHHSLVLDLMAVDPGKDLGPSGVGRTVRDAVEDEEVAQLLGGLVVAQADALQPHGQLHLCALPAIVTFAPDFGHRFLGAAFPLSVKGDGAAQVAHRVSGLLLVELNFLPLGAEDAPQALEGIVGQQVGAGSDQGRDDRVVSQP